MVQTEHIIKRTIARSHYQASATAVWCYDERFRVLLDDLYLYNDYIYIDTFRTAGGAKELATLVPSMEGQYILNQVRKSVDFHGSKRVLLMVHDTCSAYGELIPKDEKKKIEFFAEELAKAEKLVSRFLKNLGHNVEIYKYIADFEGLLLVK